jgi:hypothetical protein
MRARWGLLLMTVAIAAGPCARAQSDATNARAADHQTDPNAILASIAFAPSASAPVPLYGYSSAGLGAWNTREVSLGSSNGTVNSVSLSVSNFATGPTGVARARFDGPFDPDTQAYNLRYTHEWPAALSWSAAGYDMDFSPHAGLGVSSAGGTAEAGAAVRLGADLGRNMAHKLGLHTVAAPSATDSGRWYLFAAVSGQAVGLNMAPGVIEAPRSVWLTQSSPALMSDAQAGVGWRKGQMQASFGYVHREIRGEALAAYGLTSNDTVSDSMVAISLSIHPR